MLKDSEANTEDTATPPALIRCLLRPMRSSVTERLRNGFVSVYYANIKASQEKLSRIN